MDPATQAAIEAAINDAAGVASVVAPEYAPFIILGKAVAAAAPALITDVQNLLSGQAPSASDTAALAAKINALANPATV